MIVDTHIHLYSEQFDDDRERLIKNAMSDGINTFLMPNIDANTIDPMLKLNKEFPD